MLTHSSGLTRDVGEGWNGPDFKFISTEVLKKTVLDLKTLYPGSTYFQYSNFAMNLLGEVIASKSGTTFTNYVEENIINNLVIGENRFQSKRKNFGKNGVYFLLIETPYERAFQKIIFRP